MSTITVTPCEGADCTECARMREALRLQNLLAFYLLLAARGEPLV